MTTLIRPEGSVGVGDQVLAGGAYATVANVTAHPPGHRPNGCPIVDDRTAIEVRTDHGTTRWLGVEHAWIGADLRMHWRGGPGIAPPAIGGA